MTFSVLFDCVAEEKEKCRTTLTLFTVKLDSCTSTPFDSLSKFEPWHGNVWLYSDTWWFSIALSTVPLPYLYADQLRRLYRRRRRYAMHDYVSSKFVQMPAISLYSISLDINSKEGGEISGDFTLTKGIFIGGYTSRFHHGAFLTSFSFIV